MIISISEAARLAGRSRQTLYAMRDRGQLSFTTDNLSGTVGLDMAELCRVFPHIKPDNVGQQTVVNSRQSLTTTNDSAALQALQRQIDLLERIIEEKDARLALLEHRPVNQLKQQPEPIQPAAKKRSLFDRLTDGLNAALK